MSDSLGLVDFAIGLVNSVLNLPDGQVIIIIIIIIMIMNLLCANSMHIRSNAHYNECYTLKVKIKAN